MLMLHVTMEDVPRDVVVMNIETAIHTVGVEICKYKSIDWFSSIDIFGPFTVCM